MNDEERVMMGEDDDQGKGDCGESEDGGRAMMGGGG